MKNNTPSYNDLIAISYIFKEHLFTKYNFPMEIVFKTDKETLNLINSDLFYRNDMNGKPEDTDEIIVRMNGCVFKYELEGEE